MLSTVRELVSRHDLAAALPLALTAWRQRPCGELAVVVVAIAELAPVLGGKTPSIESLLAAPEPSRLPEALGWLDRSRNSPAMKRNLEALVNAWPEDPRITDWLCAFLACPHWDLAEGSPADLAATIVRLLAESRDERVDRWVRRLPALFEARRGSRKGQLSKDEIDTLDRLFRGAELIPGQGRKQAQMASTLTAAEVADLAAVQAELKGIGGQGERDRAQRARLLQAVIEQWDADEPKQVYADYLQERNDPQGELIALELHADVDDKKTRSRLTELRGLVRHAIGVPASGWQKGFPRVVTVWGAEGPTSLYGEEQAWGTVQSVDVPPTSDACHTENLRTLRVAVSYLKDLARLTKPLAVTCFGVLNASQRARAPLRKVRVLEQVERLELIQPAADDDYGWLFAIPWLEEIQQLSFVAIPTRSMAPVAVAATSYFAKAPKLASVTFQPTRDGVALLELRRRDDSAAHLIIEAENDKVVQALVAAFAPLARPSFASVELRSPVADLEGLQDLGREQTVVQTGGSEPVVDLDGDVVIVTPPKGEVLLDATTLRRALSSLRGVYNKVRAEGLDLAWLSRYLEVCGELGFDELWLHGRVNYSSHTIHRGADGWLEVSLTTYALPRDLFDSVPGAKLRLRCSPSIDLDDVTARFTADGRQVEALHDEEVRLAQFAVKYVKKPRRLELNAGYSALSMPSCATVDLLRSRYLDTLPAKIRAKQRIDELRVCVRDVTLGPELGDWIDWVDQQDCAIVFKSSANEMSRFEPSSGGEKTKATLHLRHLGVPSTWAAQLAAVGDKRLSQLVVLHGFPVAADVLDQLERISIAVDLSDVHPSPRRSV
jgi:uncharacterized protein (TIGR02996 family)